jgi:hypothetical protein
MRHSLYIYNVRPVREDDCLCSAILELALELALKKCPEYDPTQERPEYDLREGRSLDAPS